MTTFSEEEEWAYEQKFHKYMTPRCFQRLLAIAEWRDLPAKSIYNQGGARRGGDDPPPPAAKSLFRRVTGEWFRMIWSAAR